MTLPRPRWPGLPLPLLLLLCAGTGCRRTPAPAAVPTPDAGRPALDANKIGDLLTSADRLREGRLRERALHAAGHVTGAALRRCAVEAAAGPVPCDTRRVHEALASDLQGERARELVLAFDAKGVGVARLGDADWKPYHGLLAELEHVRVWARRLRPRDSVVRFEVVTVRGTRYFAAIAPVHDQSGVTGAVLAAEPLDATAARSEGVTLGGPVSLLLGAEVIASPLTPAQQRALPRRLLSPGKVRSTPDGQWVLAPYDRVGGPAEADIRILPSGDVYGRTIIDLYRVVGG